MHSRLVIIAAAALAMMTDVAGAQEYEQPYGSTAGQYPTPPVDRADFAPLSFVDAPGTTAVFTEVMVDPFYIEEVKNEIRLKLPNAHVRRIISGSAETDQTLMIMWHPKEAFRPAINDYFRVLDPMRGVRGTRTYLGTSDRFPESYPSDTLLGWRFVKFDPQAAAARMEEISAGLSSDPDVLEVSELAGSDWDLVVVYRFSGSSIGAMKEVQDRVSVLVGNDDVLGTADPVCP